MIGPVTAQDDTADLRRELANLRKDYETRIRQLEQRIDELESQPSPAPPSAPRRPSSRGAKSGLPAPGPVPAPGVPESAEAAVDLARLRNQANAEFDGDTEIRDITRNPDFEESFTERLEDVLEGHLDITGYFRAGYGRSDKGGPQQAFGIPGVAKYRLGNEAENYGELAFAKTFFSPGAFSSGGDPRYAGPIVHANVRLAFYNPYDNFGSPSDTDFSVPETWASVANVIAADPDIKFWAGNRFYRRHDIHVNDYYFWDMSGGGGGVEDITLGSGKLAVAWIGDGSESSIYSQVGDPDPDNLAGFSKTNLDVRWYDWPLLGGTGELGFAYSHADSGRDADGNSADDADGFSVSLVRTKQGDDHADSLHKTSIQLGNGPAKTFSSGFETFTTEDGTFIRPDPSESWRFRFTDQLVSRPWECLSLGTVLVYQYTDFGDDAPEQHWVSGGLRPIWHFTDSFSVAFEGGVDWVSNSSTGDGGALGKLTIAPQLSLGDGFFSRPVIRAFVTFATWSDDLQGGVGGRDYERSDSGASWGVQMEAWW